MIPTHKQINDISLEDYIAVKPKYATFVPHTAGRYAAKRFRKAQCPIVERIVNSLMMHGRNNGKKLMAARIVRHAMDIIFLLTDQNPLQVIVDAVINAGPREDATRVGSAGVVRRQAVDISPLRRVNDAIYLLTTGAREAAFRNVKTMAECLGGEREDEMEQIFTDSTALTFFGGRLHGGTKLPIRELAQWARTSHGGKQTEMFELTAVDGCVRWGMCESPLSDRELVKIREGSRGRAPSHGQ